MSCCSKEKMERNDPNNTCKSHSAKSDREMYRICPSRLSKKELEDLYFTLLENNLELKKTINGQQDKIRVLSTQVQRMTNTHDKIMSKEMKECSTGTKALVNEQNDFIAELKETNQRLAERIQQLNMRLCSAKQFSKMTPPQTSTSRRFRSVTASPPKKHNCLPKDQNNEKVCKLSTASQWEDRRPSESDQPCDENKCRCLMEELKVKIVTLQDELFNVHDEYSTRIGRLETEVSEVRKENVRVCSERSASEHELQNTVKRTSNILAQYRLSEAKCNELTTELAIEKRKVAELETQLKAVNMSDKVNKTIEEHLKTIQETNFETCGCKVQLKSLPVPIPASTEVTCGCKAQLMRQPVHIPASNKDIQCDLCGCDPPINTSTPLKDENAKCKKCCFKDKHEATESPPSKNDRYLSPGGATNTWSPSKDKDSIKPSKTGDDSGYQDTDELVLIKQNKQLMTKIFELQNEVDHMKIRICGMSEVKPGNLSKSTGSPKKTRDYAAAAPLLGELAKINIPEEQMEYNKSIGGENYELTKQIPLQSMGSDERVRELGKILSIEILGNPKVSVRTQNWGDTRAKTTEDANGTLQIIEEASSDKFDPLILMNDDYREHNKSDSPKLKILEKKKLEISRVTSDVSGLGFNPEKLKYLEAEGIIAKPKFGEDMSKLKEDSVSLTESVPSNPELGFGIARLASKASQAKSITESDSGQSKKSPAAGSLSSQQARDDFREAFYGKLKLQRTESLVANHPTAPKQTDEKKKEDCEYCAACSFDKECELKHRNATNHRMNTLAPGIQREQAKKHDQHNSLQIPGPIPSSDSNKSEKMTNSFSHFMIDRSSKQKKEDFIINQNKYGEKITATTDGPANLHDVPLVDKRQFGTNCIKIDKKILSHDKITRSIEQKKESPTKEDSIVKPKTYAQNACAMTDGPISVPDVPPLDKRQDSKDALERKPSRIVFNMNNIQDPPLLEVKMPTYSPHSESMLPILLAPTNGRGKAKHVERKADVVQRTDPKLAEKSSQVPTNIDSAWLRCTESCRQRGVSLYRRRSGTLCYRARPAPACSCPGQQDGYCSDKPRDKAHDKEEVKSPRDQRRGLLTSECGTYTVNSKQTSTSPENTDREMSDLSDLPMEKEKKSMFKSRPLSPGEDRTTTFTNTPSYYSPPSHSWLSEGEMPATTSKRKHSEPDIDKPFLNAAIAHKEEIPQSQQMEAALQAISEELRRCRNMLHANRVSEVSRLANAVL